MKRLVSILAILLVLFLVIGCGGQAGTATPTVTPSASPAETPTATPSASPTVTPTLTPSASPTAPAYPWPTQGWQTSTPEKQGMDSKKLDAMMTYISDQKLAIDSVLAVRHGYIVFEQYPGLLYDKGMPHQIFSCSKSVLGALIGIAVREGYIDSLQHKMLDYFNNRTIQNLDDHKKDITIEHLLKMNAGMEFNEWRYPYTDPRNDFIKVMTSPDPIQHVLDLPMATAPGTVWNYCGGYTYLLTAVLMQATGMNLLDFANKYLFGPLGITNVQWLQNNNVSKTISNFYDAADGLFLTPRDMAKFGYLILHNGVWEGRQIVPADYVANSVKTQTPFGSNSGYGYESWWTYPLEGVYYASGIYGQKIFVVPSLDLVAVFTATIYRADVEEQMHTLIRDYIIPACK
jgi:CubicO group peptidase (beta-lactamase class C family)